ncbi:hypothetical protein VaNZ11_004779 [Volvox africanus]|uniref:Non-specific serine/threonine protein kinase n=1 Tax=Volvox africanus TaxID=51714 RepID=A0ABQ5RX46_9CHLO|nr:hypothetical protein VaNZ11_004779 [Volvox africanus]
MARRRGGAPQAAEGDVWRRQQQLTALTTVLQQLPQGDGVPLALFRSLQRVMKCVQHTLQGLPGGDGAAVADGSSTAGGGGGSDGDGGESPDASSTCRPEDEIAKSCKLDGFENVSHGNGEHPGLIRSSVAEQLAVERAVEILQDLLASLSAESNFGNGSSSWDSVSYITMLMHSYVALSSDLLDAGTLRGDDVSNVADDSHSSGYGRTEFCRDELAAPAPGKLPAGVYAHIVRAMGWETYLIELLVWIPDPWIACAALGRIIELCPDLAPALAGVFVRNAGDADEDTCDASANAIQRAAGGCVAHLQLKPGEVPLWPFHWVSQVSHNPVIALRLAKAVRKAAAATIATTTARGAVANEREGRRWLTCLLLLGRTIAEALRRQVVPSAVKDVAAVTENHKDGVTWIDECCEALQEGLCAWQADILAHGAATLAAGPETESATDATTLALLQLVQGELRDLLNEQQVAGAGDRVLADPRCLLSCSSVIRLRTRIMLLTMQGPATGAAAVQPPHPPWPSSGDRSPAVVTAANARHRKELFNGQDLGACRATKLVAGNVWPYLDSSIESSTAKLMDGSGKTARPEGMGEACSGALSSAPSTPMVAARSRVSDYTEARMRRLPEWLRVATAATTAPAACISRCDGGNLHLVLSSAAGSVPRAAILVRPQLHETVATSPQRDGALALMSRVLAISVALLTPGIGSWLRVQRDPRFSAAAGPEPYSPFRVALALLELLQGRLHGLCLLSEVDRSAGGAVTASSDTHGADVSGSNQKLAAEERKPGKQHQYTQDVETVQQLEFRMLQMVAECVACVEKPEQQDALQAVVLSAPSFRSLRTRLANDAALQAAAGRALVALSNRAAALEGSLDHLALSAQQEAQRLAAAATDLLPYAVLTPEACVRRLVLDGLTHPGQQPWVLQLLRCFAVAAAASAAAAAVTTAAETRAAMTPPSILLSCLRDVVLQDAARWLRTAAEKRSLLGLLSGLLRLGLVTAQQVLLSLVEPGLSTSEDRQHRPVAQVHCALLIAQFVSGGSGAGVDFPIINYSPMAELAAARPARLMLATAQALRDLYEEYESTGRLESPAIDAAVAVLERSVLLYGNCIRNGDGGKHAFANYTRELSELAAGCVQLPRRLTLILLPLLEMAASSAEAASHSPNSAGGAAGGGGMDGDDDGANMGNRVRTLTATFVPAAAWRPRSLRSANAASARAAMFDTLTFAASSVANAAALRQALLDGAENHDQKESVEEGSNDEDATKLWTAWGAEVMFEDTAVVMAAPACQHGVIHEGQIGRHVAATIARGVPQLPAARLVEGCILAMSAILPTAAPEQARRLLLGVMPTLVRAAGGAAVLHATIQNSSGSAAAIVTAAAAAGAAAQGISIEDFGMWLLVAPVRRCSTAAAAVAISMVLACRATEVALRSVALLTQSACVSAGTAEPEAADVPPGRTPLSPPLAVRATADRCAAHLAMLASRLAIASTAAAAADSATPLDRDALPATLATIPSRIVLELDGQASMEVAAISLVLLSELCGVASVAAEVAVPWDDRAMDLWQAMILSVLQCLVRALATWRGSQVMSACTTGAVPAPQDIAKQFMSSVRRALYTLPTPQADLLWGSLERLCEDYDVQEGREAYMAPSAEAGGIGWLSEALYGLDCNC